MANENPIEGEIDKQKIIREVEQTKIAKVEPLLPEQIGKADSKVTTKKLDDIISETRITRKRTAERMDATVIQPTLWESARAYRNELSTLITLAIGALWLLIAYMSHQTTPLVVAAIFIFPTILYIFQNFRSGF